MAGKKANGTEEKKPKYSGPLRFYILRNLKPTLEFRIERDLNESFFSKLFSFMR